MTYTNETFGDLAGKDTDGDDVLDWEEGLWGTDPTKKDSDADGTPDGTEIYKLKAISNSTEGIGSNTKTENTTKTSQFASELLTTIATLNQSGGLDDLSMQQLGASLAENIQNSTQKKIYTSSNLNIISDSSIDAIKKYQKTRYEIYNKYPNNINTLGILQEFNSSEENFSALSKFDIVIKEKTKIINDLIKMPVPQSLAFIHLSLINISQGILENVTDMKSMDTDPLLAFSAITQYENNLSKLVESASQLTETINQILSN